MDVEVEATRVVGIGVEGTMMFWRMGLVMIRVGGEADGFDGVDAAMVERDLDGTGFMKGCSTLEVGGGA